MKTQLRRHPGYASRPDLVKPLNENHPAIVEGRTLFPGTVVDVADSPRVLVSGINSRKLGAMVTKGKWAGMPIYHLTLTERATCPRSCAVYTSCFGNGMHQARRHRHGPELEFRLMEELRALGLRHRQGFVVRLHTLGDFYSVDYVRFWEKAILNLPVLHVFGYTAWGKDTAIGRELAAFARAHWGRFAIRQSGAAGQKRGAHTIWRHPEGRVVAEGVVCPAELDSRRCCGSCSLCWAAPDIPIVFVAHGNPGSKGVKRDPVARAALAEKVLALWNQPGHTTMQRVADELKMPRASVARIVSPAMKDGRAIQRLSATQAAHEKLVSGEARRRLIEAAA
jgi:hypothetical protein